MVQHVILIQVYFFRTCNYIRCIYVTFIIRKVDSEDSTLYLELEGSEILFHSRGGHR